VNQEKDIEAYGKITKIF